MAPKFSKNMYKVFNDDKGAVVCFTQKSLDKLFVLREIKQPFFCKFFFPLN